MMSSLGMLVGFRELSGETQFLASKTFRIFEYFLVTAIIYYVIVKLILGASRLISWRLFKLLRGDERHESTWRRPYSSSPAFSLSDLWFYGGGRRAYPVDFHHLDLGRHGDWLRLRLAAVGLPLGRRGRASGWSLDAFRSIPLDHPIDPLLQLSSPSSAGRSIPLHGRHLRADALHQRPWSPIRRPRRYRGGAASHAPGRAAPWG